MSEPFIGEIRLFTGNYAPRYWALCNGAILSVSQHTSLFAVLGSYFGGNGRTTFALPDMKDRAVIGTGMGPGLSDRRIGFTGGQFTAGIAQNQMPLHSHDVDVNAGILFHAGTENGVNHEPEEGNYIAVSFGDETGTQVNWYSETDDDLVQLGGVKTSGSTTVLNTGGGLAHINEQPGLGVNFIIALEGIFPTRS
ncbi:phage tail protein [Desulfoluna butyratoxydans]|uniref:Phage tail collar domain n=1 Tax=Desulfoluna butyratoxydans TaxID=231438 RepID=A0A4U8YQJ6_9BACT|nr:tail fiber protein [Desulfoluna butyratoxydans]VFQ46100.1 phage tail collar domain [Desulfoluna butyratoxydans]